MQCIGEMRKACRILDKYPKVKRPLAGCMHRWDDNIKMDLKETGCGLNLSGSG
jgi:hypothetical protein